jgi:hypothetical protein
VGFEPHAPDPAPGDHGGRGADPPGGPHLNLGGCSYGSQAAGSRSLRMWRAA